VNPGRFRSDAVDVPPCFEIWIAHLAWLDVISAAIAWSLDDLACEEAEGLALFRRARKKYWAEHLSCPACQSVNPRSASFCGGCGKDF